MDHCLWEPKMQKDFHDWRDVPTTKLSHTHLGQKDLSALIYRNTKNCSKMMLACYYFSIKEYSFIEAVSILSRNTF